VAFATVRSVLKSDNKEEIVRRLFVLIVCALTLPVSAAGAWTWPVDGPVLRPFSFDRAHPYAGGQHRGIDLGAATGTPVLAPAEGVVSFAGTVPTGGKSVSIQTPFGYTATLLHLGSIGVTRGTLVGEGSVVGSVGTSGVPEQSEPYVYFGVRTTSDQQGYVDPLTLLPPRPVLAPPNPVVEAPAAEAPAAAAPAAAAPAAEASPTAAPAEPAELAEPARVVADEPSTTAEAEAGHSSVPATPNVGAEARSDAAEPAGDAAASEEAALVAASPASAVGSQDIAPKSPAPPLAPEVVSIVRPTLQPTPDLPVDRPDSDTAGERRAGAHPEGVATAGSALHGSITPRRAHREPREAADASHAVSHGSAGWHRLRVAIALAALALAAALAIALRRPGIQEPARIMSLPEPEHVLGEAEPQEDPGRAGMAVCVREASPGPRGRLRSAGGHLRALPPLEGERRPDGEWHGRARDAGDGHGRSGRRLAA
jgi:hypothetical protein